jgi:hypothetical protein
MTSRISPLGRSQTPQTRGLRQPATASGHYWAQPPSAADKAAALPGQINIVFGAGDKKVYFYNRSGVIGKPMKLKDFLGQ